MMGRGGTRQFPVRSCGKRHSFCRECNPRAAEIVSQYWGGYAGRYGGHKFTAEEQLRGARRGGRNHPIGCGCPFHCSRRSSDNPAWKGEFCGYGSGWKAARLQVWERDKVCRACGGLPSPIRRLDVHHIVEPRNGGTNDLNNLVGLHHGCHMKVHAGKAQVDERLLGKQEVESSNLSAGSSPRS